MSSWLALTAYLQTPIITRLEFVTETTDDARAGRRPPADPRGLTPRRRRASIVTGGLPEFTSGRTTFRA
jgi:hypothetical protein